LIDCAPERILVECNLFSLTKTDLPRRRNLALVQLDNLNINKLPVAKRTRSQSKAALKTRFHDSNGAEYSIFDWVGRGNGTH